MELRVLQYFLAVTREQSISGAAEALHLSQPTLSRQLKDMEDELGKQLLIRGNRKITLTDEGMILRKRAEEIMELVRKTEQEITLSDDILSGEIHIGAGETEGVHYLTQAAGLLRKEYPGIRYHISSGDTADVSEQLDKGLLDFGLLFEPIDRSRYESISLPLHDTWGVLMRRDSALAQKEAVSPADLWEKPLIVNRNLRENAQLSAWLGKSPEELPIVATYNLLYNASLMVKDGLGYALALDKIINTEGSDLCFRPLSPALSAGMNVVWKKYQLLSKPAEKFLLKLQEVSSYSDQHQTPAG